MELSIIIPTYKVEKYISKCLDSCILQNIPEENYEIIAIDDGSPDKCGSILDEYSERYPNVVVIHQDNQGLSVSRNIGLQKAKGKYVWFVDSDDYIERNCLSDIIKKLHEFEPDLMHLSYRIIHENTSKEEIINYEQEDLSKTECTGKENLKNKFYPIPAQMTIYRREYLLKNNLHFFPNILHEDLEFKPRAIYLANKVIWHNDIVYNFIKGRAGSITSNFKLKNAIGYTNVIKNLHNFKVDHINERECAIAFNEIIGLAINNILYGLKTLPDNEQRIVKNKMNKFKEYYKDMRNTNNLKYIIEGVLLSMNQTLALMIHKIIR